MPHPLCECGHRATHHAGPRHRRHPLSRRRSPPGDEQAWQRLWQISEQLTGVHCEFSAAAHA